MVLCLFSALAQAMGRLMRAAAHPRKLTFGVSTVSASSAAHIAHSTGSTRRPSFSLKGWRKKSTRIFAHSGFVAGRSSSEALRAAANGPLDLPLRFDLDLAVLDERWVRRWSSDDDTSARSIEGKNRDLVLGLPLDGARLRLRLPPGLDPGSPASVAVVSGERRWIAEETSTFVGLRTSWQPHGLAAPGAKLRLQILGTTERLGLVLAAPGPAGCVGGVLWTRGGATNEAVLPCLSAQPDIQLSVRIKE